MGGDSRKPREAKRAKEGRNSKKNPKNQKTNKNWIVLWAGQGRGLGKLREHVTHKN